MEGKQEKNVPNNNFLKQTLSNLRWINKMCPNKPIHLSAVPTGQAGKNKDKKKDGYHVGWSAMNRTTPIEIYGALLPWWYHLVRISEISGFFS